MKQIPVILIFILLVSNLNGQDQKQFTSGSVSYVTSQNVYVKFASTDGIHPGDTLFIRRDGKVMPALVVDNLSSISCVCSPVEATELSVSDEVLARKTMAAPPATEETVEEDQGEIAVSTVEADTIEDSEEEIAPGQQISGRFSVSSYSNFSNTEGGSSQRMRYTFSLYADHIRGSKFSFETYISFAHRFDRWEEIQESVFNGLKIYNLSARYDINETTRLLLGRKINPRISSLGAVDGLQFEKQFKSITLGAFAGSRPDYQDYSVNFNLFQAGLYVSHDYKGTNGRMQSTLGFVDQENNWNTDRRFLYLQHTNSLVKNLYFFGSSEIDLYKKVGDTTENTFDLSNLYLMLRYRIIRQLSVSVSYSARNNIIYYETYKDIIERLLEQEMMQGFRIRVTARPVKNLSVGVTAGYRYRKPDPRPSRNLHGYVTYARVPGLLISATVSATYLESAYLTGTIYSAGISRELVPGKLQAGLNYRHVDYDYTTTDLPIVQNMGEVNLTWRVYKKLSLSIYYEGTFEDVRSYNRVFVNLTQRI